jgi:hypothetical protein
MKLPDLQHDFHTHHSSVHIAGNKPCTNHQLKFSSHTPASLQHSHCLARNHSIIHSNHLIIPSIIPSIIQSFNQSFNHSINQSFIHSFFHSFIHSFFHPFILAFIDEAYADVRTKVVLKPLPGAWLLGPAKKKPPVKLSGVTGNSRVPLGTL